MFVWPHLTKTVKWIVIINSAIWLLEVLFLRTKWGAFLYNFFLVPGEVVDGKIWQLITYSIFHSPNMVLHLILNMLILWMFSESLEKRWGRKKFLIFYLIAAFVGGIFAFLEGMFIIASHQWVPTIGASASVFAITAAFALTFPEKTIYLIFFPMKAKYLLYIDLGVILLSYLSLGNSSVSDAAHLGGIFTAFIFTKIPWNLYFRKKYRLKRVK